MDKLLTALVANAAGIPEPTEEALTKIRTAERAKLRRGYLVLACLDGGWLDNHTYFKLFYCTEEELPYRILKDNVFCKAFNIDPTKSDALAKIHMLMLLADNIINIIPTSLLLHRFIYDDATNYRTDESPCGGYTEV